MDPLEFAALVGIGVGIGLYAAAVGAGGGFLFGPLLLARHGSAEPAEIALASMCLVLGSGLLSTAINARARRMDWRAIGLVGCIAVPGAIIGATLTRTVPREAFASVFVVLLGGLSLYLLARPRSDAGEVGRRGWRRLHRARGETYLYWIPVPRTLAVTGLTSAVTALAGIGGGLFFSLIGVRVMRMPVALAVPASHGVVTTIAACVVVVHVAGGQFGDPLRDVPPLLIGALAANPFGHRITARLRESGLARLLALGLAAAAVRTAFEAF